MRRKEYRPESLFKHTHGPTDLQIVKTYLKLNNRQLGILKASFSRKIAKLKAEAKKLSKIVSSLLNRSKNQFIPVQQRPMCSFQRNSLKKFLRFARISRPSLFMNLH